MGRAKRNPSTIARKHDGFRCALPILRFTAIIPLSGKHGEIHFPLRLAAVDTMRHDRAEQYSKPQAMRQPNREAFMKTSSYRHFRRCAGDVGDRGIGAEQAAAQARRHPRHVEPLCRYHRAGLGDRREDGGRGFRRRGARPQDRDRRGRSSQQGRPFRQHRPRHVRQSGRRDALRRRGVRHRACRRRDCEGAQQDRDLQWPRLDPAQQRGLRPLYRALCVRHLRAGQCDRSRRRQAGPR